METAILWWSVGGLVFWFVIHMNMKIMNWNWRREIPMAILCGPITTCILLVLVAVGMPIMWVIDKCSAWLEE